jgi:hypothetical protein
MSKKKLTKKRASGVAQSVDPEFKPQYCERERESREDMHTWAHFVFLATCRLCQQEGHD